jgi:putative transcription antitermination factor YqgF
MKSQEGNKANISHYLGIDYGASDIGLALADSETRMAFAYGKLKNDKNLLQKIAEIVEKENAETIIIGIPSYINRDDVKYEGERIGEIIKEKLKMNVHYQNEMFTTKMAQANLIEKGVKGIKKHDDEEAARIILQEWLDRNH